MATTLGELAIKLKANTAEFARDMKKVRDSLDKVADKAKKIGPIATVAFGAFSIAAIKAIGIASDLEENLNKVEVAFGKKLTPAVLKWAEKVSESMGRSKLQMREFASSMQMMLVSMMGNKEAAAEMSMGLSELAVDIASVENIKDELEVLAALRSALSGETEPMKKFGVVMTEAALNAYALSKGINKTTKEMSVSEKAIIRYAYIMEHTKHYQGDAARTSDSYANSLKSLKGNINDLTGDIGKGLLPTGTLLVHMLKSLVKYFKNLSPMAKKLASTLLAVGIAGAGLTVVLSATALALPKIYDGILLAINGFKKLATVAMALKATLIPIFALVMAIIGTIGAISFAKKVIQDPEGLKKQLGLKGNEGPMETYRTLVKSSFGEGFSVIGKGISSLTDSFMKTEDGSDKFAEDLKKSSKVLDGLLASIKDSTNASDKMSGGMNKISSELDFKGLNQEAIAAATGFGTGENLAAPAMPKVRVGGGTYEAPSDEAIAIADFIDTIKSGAQTLGEAFIQSGQKMRAVYQGAIEGAKQGGPWGAIIGAIVALLQKTEAFGQVVNEGERGLGGVVELLQAFVGMIVPLIKGITDGVMVGLRLNMSIINSTKGLKILSKVFELVGSVLTWFSEKFEWAFSSTIGKLNKFFHYLTDAWNWLIGTLAKFFENFKLTKKIGEKLRNLLVTGDVDWETRTGSGGGDRTTDREDVERPARRVGDAMNDAADAANKLASSLTNVPEGFKVAAARYNAIDAGMGEPGLADSGGSGGRRLNSGTTNNYFVALDAEGLFTEMKRLGEAESSAMTGSPLGGLPFAVPSGGA